MKPATSIYVKSKLNSRLLRCASRVDRPAAPWHFKLLLVALVLYLGYRAYQGIAWLAHHA